MVGGWGWKRCWWHWGIYDLDDNVEVERAAGMGSMKGGGVGV